MRLTSDVFLLACQGSFIGGYVYMIGCPVSHEQLIAFAAAELAPAEAAAVARHVSTCARCAATVRRYQAIRDLVRSDDGADPPAASLARARALMPRRARYPVSKPASVWSGRRMAAVNACIAALLVLACLLQGAHIVLAAADSSLPGDTLYPLKTTTEDIRLAATSDAADKVELRLVLVQTRLGELQKLAAQKRYRDMGVASAGLKTQVDETTKALNTLAGGNPERAAQEQSLALQSFAHASVALNTLLAQVPDSQRGAIQSAAEYSNAGAANVRNRMLGTTSTPLSVGATAIGAAASSTATPTATGTAQPAPSQMPAAFTVTPSATPVPAAFATPPGQANTPPGQARTPPGQINTPPGQITTPPGQVNTPPGQVNTPPGQANTPPGQAKTPPGQQNTPPGQAKTPTGGKP